MAMPLFDCPLATRNLGNMKITAGAGRLVPVNNPHMAETARPRNPLKPPRRLVPDCRGRNGAAIGDAAEGAPKTLFGGRRDRRSNGLGDAEASPHCGSHHYTRGWRNIPTIASLLDFQVPSRWTDQGCQRIGCRVRRTAAPAGRRRVCVRPLSAPHSSSSAASPHPAARGRVAGGNAVEAVPHQYRRPAHGEDHGHDVRTEDRVGTTHLLGSETRRCARVLPNANSVCGAESAP